MFHKKFSAPLCLLTDGSSSHGLDGMLSYSSMPRQQLLALDPNLYGGEQFRHGLTPPQLGPEQMHPYGKRQKSKQRHLYIIPQLISTLLSFLSASLRLFIFVMPPLRCYTIFTSAQCSKYFVFFAPICPKV